MTVMTFGTFDLFHVGHLNLLKGAAKLADGPEDRLLVGVNSDAFVKKYKGSLPVIPLEQRRAIVASIKGVIWAFTNSESSLKKVLLAHGADILVVGSDWRDKDYYSQIGVGQQWLDDHKITLVYLPYTQRVSTSQLRERILSEQKGDKK